MTTNPYHQLLLLTQSMLLSAEKKQWQVFAQFEYERQQIISQLSTLSLATSSLATSSLATPSLATQTDIEHLKEVACINQRLQQITASHYQKYEAQLLALARGARKSQCYTNNQSP